MRTLKVKLADLREVVDSVDGQILLLLLDRYDAIQEISEVKAKLGKNVLDPKREATQEARLTALLERRGKGCHAKPVLKIFQDIRGASREFQASLREPTTT